MSQDLQWLLLRPHNSFIVKRPNTGSKSFSREPGNVRNLHSFKYSGLANAKTVDIHLTKNKGVSLSSRKADASSNKVKAARSRKILKGNVGSRNAAGVVSKACEGRPDLRKDALARVNRLLSTRNPKKIKQRQSRKQKAAAAAKDDE